VKLVKCESFKTKLEAITFIEEGVLQIKLKTKKNNIYKQKAITAIID
jgi:hypothetical protein